MQKIQAVIFDMDGVLVDSEPINLKVETENLHALGYPIPEDVSRTFIGASKKAVQAKIQGVYPAIDLEKLQVEMDGRKEQVTIDYATIVFPGLPENLQYLRDKGIPLAVASSTYHDKVQVILKEAALIDYFDVIVGGDCVENSKPDPEIFLKAAADLNVSPKNCLVVEDSHNGVIAAHRAGMYIFGKNDDRFGQDITCADEFFDTYDEFLVSMQKKFG